MSFLLEQEAAMYPASPSNVQLIASTDEQLMKAQIEAQLAYARTHWAHFQELEPLILDVLKQWPNASLKKAYGKVLDMYVGKKSLFGVTGTTAAGDNVSWTPDQDEAKYPTVEFKGHKMGNSAIKPPQSDYWTGDPPLQAPQPKIPTAAPTSMWNMAQTRPLLKTLQPASRQFGYHVCVGGGVLNNWESKKDLDLYYLPLNNAGNSKPKELIQHLAGLWGKPTPIGNSADYPGDELPYIAKLKFEFDSDGRKRRIDLFVLGSEVFDVQACIDSLGTSIPTSFLAKIIHRKRDKK